MTTLHFSPRIWYRKARLSFHRTPNRSVRRSDLFWKAFEDAQAASVLQQELIRLSQSQDAPDAGSSYGYQTDPDTAPIRAVGIRSDGSIHVYYHERCGI